MEFFVEKIFDVKMGFFLFLVMVFWGEKILTTNLASRLESTKAPSSSSSKT